MLVSYIKKLIEDTNVGEDGIKLLQYCSWENPQFSQSILTELLWHCGFAYWHDMRYHTEILLQILLIEDSWQHHRIHNALIGIVDFAIFKIYNCNLFSFTFQVFLKIEKDCLRLFSEIA